MSYKKGSNIKLSKISFKKEIVKDIAIVAAGILIIWTSLWIVFGTQNPFYVVSSESMVPVLQVYDILVVQGNHPFESVNLGDIIVFYRPSDHDRVIVHRVVSISDEYPYSLRTKGDANPASITGVDFPITEREYIGKVVQVVPQVGYITKILTPPINYIIIAIIIGVMVFRQYMNKKSKDSEDDDSEIEFSEGKEDINEYTQDTQQSIDENQPPNSPNLDDDKEKSNDSANKVPDTEEKSNTENSKDEKQNQP
jgi:signal peptidase